MVRMNVNVLTCALIMCLFTIVFLLIPREKAENLGANFTAMVDNTVTEVTSYFTSENTDYNFDVTMKPGATYEMYHEKWGREDDDYLPSVDLLTTRLPAHFSSADSTKDPKTTVFMLRSNVSSLQYDLFSVHRNAFRVCDQDTTIGGCSVRLKGNYNWSTLSVKLVETLKIFCISPLKSDIYVKVDDDTVISETQLELLAKRLHNSDCNFVGRIAIDFQFYWGVGEIYMFKRSILDRVCASIPAMVEVSSEDILMGQLINSSETREFCSFDENDYSHQSYEDQRVSVKYKPVRM